MSQRRKIRSTGNADPSKPQSSLLNSVNDVQRDVGHHLSFWAKLVGVCSFLIIWKLYGAPSDTRSISPSTPENVHAQFTSLKTAKERPISTVSMATLNEFLVDHGESSEANSTSLSMGANPNYLIFHHYVHTKQSSAIEDMLMCHAYAFHKRATYGGACSGARTPEIVANEALLDAIGLKEALPFKCSVDYARSPKPRISTIPRSSYRKDDTRIWTPEYLEYLRSLMRYPKKKNSDDYVVAVHVRRGNTSPCHELRNGYSKYLPNSHYLSLIDKYSKPGARVIVFSQPESFESLQVFEERGYSIFLDGDAGNIWRHFLAADMLILSRSDFSMVPAHLTKGKVIYTPMWHKRGRGWVQVSDDIMQKTNTEMQQLQEQC
eukprot:scaffold925_cov129-Cylindrotheca_fusiformis.AAC.22